MLLLLRCLLWFIMVIERLSCKLGKDNEDLELQFSAAVAKVMIEEILKVVKVMVLDGIVHLQVSFRNCDVCV